MRSGLSDGATSTRREAPLMAARGVCLDIDGKTLLRQVDLEIAPGSRTVVMGANGAGKSLLLRCLHGLLLPTGGEVLWRGAPPTRAARRSQAMVFQTPVMLRRSVRANLRFSLGVRGVSAGERRAREREALSRAQLADVAERPARVLSGGEQQRLAMAQALASRPDILFLDEPTASLDPASTHAVEQLILEAQAGGAATVLVTHDSGQARRMGDNLLFLHQGAVVERGPVCGVLQTPASEAARAWVEGRLFLGDAARPTKNNQAYEGSERC